MKKLMFFVLLLFMMTGLCTDEAAARGAVAIQINGQIKSYSPGGMIVNGRTMVPVRYIVEDPALNGQADWDSVNKAVTIKCGQKEFIFTIGSNQINVDGESRATDASSFIHQGRTYIPLRFLATELGAKVAWRAASRTVAINFGNEPIVMAYYYIGTPDMLSQSSITDVAFRWLETDAQGRLFYEYWKDAAGASKRSQALAAARANGQKVHASVMLMAWDAAGRAEMHSLLSSYQNRQRLISSLRAHAAEYGYDGVNIDLEGVPTKDKDYFTSFLKELTSALHKDGRTVSVAVPAKVAGSSWHGGYDYEAIGDAVDLVVIMAYDYSFNAPGPSAPLNWVQSVTDYTVSQIPADKVLLALGAYGYDWNLKSSTKTSFFQSSLDKISDKGSKITYSFDNSSFTPVITYTDWNGTNRKVWYENAVSLKAKMNISQDKDLAGIAFWQLKGAFNDLFKVLKEV